MKKARFPSVLTSAPFLIASPIAIFCSYSAFFRTRISSRELKSSSSNSGDDFIHSSINIFLESSEIKKSNPSNQYFFGTLYVFVPHISHIFAS